MNDIEELWEASGAVRTASVPIAAAEPTVLLGNCRSMHMNASMKDDYLRRDHVVHHPMSGGAYAFRTDLVGYVVAALGKQEVRVSIGAQPNSSPHLGTVLVASLAFSLCKQLSRRDLETQVVFEVVDTAPAEIEVIDRVTYQTSVRTTGAADTHLYKYLEVLQRFSEWSDIPYEVRRQSEFNSQKIVAEIVRDVIRQQGEIAAKVAPVRRMLGIRVACLTCGLTDKHGVNNVYRDGWIESHCPRHGRFSTSISTDAGRLEFSTPLRNLVRALVYARQNADQAITSEWVRITGGDYAGLYQEELLYRCASRLGYAAHTLPHIIYSPLVTDWSGAKLSKSLCAREGAYGYLPLWVTDCDAFQRQFGDEGLRRLSRETDLWLQEPYRLFRSYSVYYFIDRLKQESALGECQARG